MAFAFLHNLIAGTNENVNDAMADLNQIKDELNGATATNTMTLAGDVTGVPSASLLSKITALNTRFGTAGVYGSPDATAVNLFYNYNADTSHSFDSSKPSWRIKLDGSADAAVFYRAAATAGVVSFTVVGTISSAGVANFIGGLQANGVAAILEGDSRLTNSRAPSGSAGGSLAGTYPNPTLAANSVGASQITDGTVGLAELASNSVNAAKIVDGTVGVAELATFPSAGIFHTGADLSVTQNISNNSFTVVQFDATGWDVGTGTSQIGINSLFCRQTGRYSLWGNVSWDLQGGGVTANRELQLRLNGTTLIGVDTRTFIGNAPSATKTFAQQVTSQYPLTSGDYVELLAYQASSTPTTLGLTRQANFGPELRMQYEGPQ